MWLFWTSTVFRNVFTHSGYVSPRRGWCVLFVEGGIGLLAVCVVWPVAQHEVYRDM